MSERTTTSGFAKPQPDLRNREPLNSRRSLLALLAAVLVVGLGVRFVLRERAGRVPELVWGKKGVLPGDFVRPRAATVDHQGRIYVVDFTARVQSYDANGVHTGATWQTPDYRNGRPSGLGTDRDGNILVCDSHYHCVQIYTPAGILLRTLGGESGTNPGQFGYVSDCVQDADGFYYLSEFGQTDRITKLDSDGRFVTAWGKGGTAPGEFQRVRALAIGPNGLLYAADACNHRVQVFAKDGTFVREFGGPGAGPGQMSYPYDVAFNTKGELYVVERGNMRVQKFTTEGQLLGSWGGPGSGPGQFADPWAVVVDKQGRVQVIDTENHRVQRIDF